MDKGKVYDFCLESTIPGIHKAIESESITEVLGAVVKRSNRDAMTGARFWDKEYSRNANYYKDKMIEILEDCKESLSSDELIDNMLKVNTCNASLGSIQKLVNMSLKYLYVLDTYGYLNNLGINIKLESIHCPIDSVILDKLKKKTKKKYTSWTKINSMEEYKKIQKAISNYVKESNLEFDFDNWES